MLKNTRTNRDPCAIGALENMTPRFQQARWGTGPETCMIYFIRAGLDGLIKIGSAKDAKARLAALQTACPVTLQLVGAIYARRDKGSVILCIPR